MLGIRTYKNFALDLWVGPREDFFCDLIVSNKKASVNQGSVVFVLSSKEAFITFYKEFLESKSSLRHIAFELSEEKETLLGQFEKLIPWVKDLMDLDFFQSTKRITFMSSSLELHDSCQQEIFQTF